MLKHQGRNAGESVGPEDRAAWRRGVAEYMTVGGDDDRQ